MAEGDSRSKLLQVLSSPELLAGLVDEIPDGIYILDRDRRIVYWNKGASDISGYDAGEVIGKRCQDNILVHVDERARPLCFGNCPAKRAMEDDATCESDAYLHHKSGHRVPIHIRVAPIKASDGEVVGGVEIFNDNRAQLEARHRIEELERLSLLDPLTGVGNRRHADAYLTARLAEFERYGWEFGLLFFDIDNFKRVNDTYGHEVGDSVLKMVSLTARNSIRAADVVSRWGGEEFTAVLQRVDKDILVEIAHTTRRLIQESSVDYEGDRVSVTVSIGCTLVKEGDTVEAIVDRADALMYASKEAGRNKVTFG